jgi:hypothetical protein
MSAFQIGRTILEQADKKDITSAVLTRIKDLRISGITYSVATLV